MAYKAICGQVLVYLSDLLQPYVSYLLLVVLRSRLVHSSDLDFFLVVAPKLWDQLLLHITHALTLGVLKSHLKLHLYLLVFNTIRGL